VAPWWPVEYATGIVVSKAGHIITGRTALDDCQFVVVPGFGNAVRVAEDTASDLALLQVFAGKDLTPAALAEGGGGGDVTLVGIADPQAQGGGGAVGAVKTRVSETLALDPPPALGFDGAAALDAQGRLTGIAAVKTPVVAGAAPTPVVSATLVPVETIRNFLDAHNVAPAMGAVSGVEAAKGSVVRVICVRK
jgi:hypothetical protein